MALLKIEDTTLLGSTYNKTAENILTECLKQLIKVFYKFF